MSKNKGTFKLSLESDKLLSILLACALGSPDTTDGRNAYVLAETNLRGRLREIERAIVGVVDAWESLPPDYHYVHPTVQEWLEKKMKPAIASCREVMS